MKYKINMENKLLWTTGKGISKGKPLIILLHGYGANCHNLIGLSNYFPNHFVIALDAPIDLGGGRGWTHINYINGEKSYDLELFEISRQLVLSTIHSLVNMLEIDSEDITLLGFSQGAVMSFSLGLSSPNIFKRVIGLSGFIHQEFVNPILGNINDIKRVKFFIGHGMGDQVVPIERGISSCLYLDSLGIDYTWREYSGGHMISEEEIRDIIKWL
jgi:phospholipase/carboxylesterase